MLIETKTYEFSVKATKKPEIDFKARRMPYSTFFVFLVPWGIKSP